MGVVCMPQFSDPHTFQPLDDLGPTANLPLLPPPKEAKQSTS